ncbi:MAG: hypothetical protein GXO02_03740 [Epsilonproteobacteria bacterium]|nr:hypothetical protein [Campylobacterota bacterium]
MKRAYDIVNNLNRFPHFKSVHKYSCYNKLLELLPPRYQKAIAFFYIKNNTLFGALKHPGYKMELNYNKDLVKALLNQISMVDMECKEVFKDVKNIQFFASKFFEPPKKETQTIPFYKELAKGEFEIKIKDRDLEAIFLKIKEDIEANARD